MTRSTRRTRGALLAIALAAGIDSAVAAADAPAAGAAKPAAVSEKAPARRERKKVQEVDLKRLEIRGRIEDPSSVFVLETGRLLLPGVDFLKGILPPARLAPVDKEALDGAVVSRIEERLGVVKR
jgi:hypothetical protein